MPSAMSWGVWLLDVFLLRVGKEPAPVLLICVVAAEEGVGSRAERLGAIFVWECEVGIGIGELWLWFVLWIFGVVSCEATKLDAGR